MFKVLVAILFLSVGGTLGYIAMTQENFCILCEKQSDSSSTYSNGLQNLLISDLAVAAKNKELPASWDQIVEVRYVYHSKKIQRILNNSPIIGLNKKGTKKLLVEFFDEPGADNIVMARYNVVDIASGNTIGEMNRRLKIPEVINSMNSTGNPSPAFQKKK